ncbi:hypothetical protein GUB10_13790 [Salegentibacter sp. BLCTC]|uniref:hypothetical protein n=1 Tax=Salegentibacter sp. BLCTC TaxID=2697368 RepID=UPI00187BA722|nr:hypothetical protein [Salegentibacter sp. BLCTC]MBE7641407.1 hypothetical protein [Salegentibacter sp. BLCTC]
MKAVKHSWWIGAIIGPILTIVLVGSPNPEYGMLIFAGLVNGIFWGWIIGLIIDKVRGTSGNRQNPSTKSNRSDSYVRNSGNKPALRRDGYYLSSIETEDNKPIFFVLFFTSKGFVAFQELDEFDDSELTTEDYQQILAEGEALSEIEISSNLTKFHKSGTDIYMKFYNPEDSSNIDPIEKVPYEEPNVYNKWSGQVIPGGLLLDLETRRFNYSLKNYSKEKQIKNLKFKFVPISMN